MTKPHNAIPYVRQRTFGGAYSYVRQRTVACATSCTRYRTVAFIGVTSLIALTSCASTSPSTTTPRGLDSIQSAVTCPLPPSHSAVAAPVRAYTAKPGTVIGRNVGYCAYVDTSRGMISIRLRPEFAPHAVNDFVYLAQRGFYDRLAFYAVCPASTGPPCPLAAPVALAGDPTGSGSGGPGYTAVADPVVGDYLFGAVAMYGTDPSTIGSQFFISKGDSSSLARKYDIFGQVTDGIPTLAELQKGDTIAWVAIVATAPEP
jgi:cyclophilin family peptidyl-prolyl cis-trans isomerase